MHTSFVRSVRLDKTSLACVDPHNFWWARSNKKCYDQSTNANKLPKKETNWLINDMHYLIMPLPRACQIIRNVLLTSALPVFRFFFDCNHLKQEFGYEFEQQFELELNSNKNLSSSHCFCSRSAHARRRPWEPPDTLIVGKFQLGGPAFLERFSEWFFSQNWCQIEPQLQKGNKSYKKRSWNEVHKTCWKCAQFSTLGLARNALSNGMVVKNH